MPSFEKELLTILATDVFKSIIGNQLQPLAKINAAIALLVKTGIPFTLSYSPGTRRVSPGFELTVFINPSTSLVFHIAVDHEQTIFDIIT
jgi:hypothetical protein